MLFTGELKAGMLAAAAAMHRHFQTCFAILVNRRAAQPATGALLKLHELPFVFVWTAIVTFTRVGRKNKACTCSRDNVTK